MTVRMMCMHALQFLKACATMRRVFSPVEESNFMLHRFNCFSCPCRWSHKELW